MMLVARNAETWVYSLEPANSEPARIAQAFGARYISAADTPLSEVTGRTGSVDVVAEAVGHASVAFSALQTLAPNGVFVFTGIPGGGKTVEIDLDSVMRNIVLNNQVLLGVVNASRSAFEAAVSKLEQFMGLFPEAVQSLITERVALERAPELLAGPGRIKQVVTLNA
jgi:threonine dehydrogenase-like Zn-dependent dehydrogenase